MVKDGYYLFVYSEIDPILNVMGLSLRHDHNIAVFRKEGSHVELICHLEIERFSGRKHHNVAFYDKEEASLYLNGLLKPYNLTLNNFEGIYGTPGFGSDDNNLSYTSILDVKQISYHAISHLFTSLVLDADKFYNNDIIALAFDGGPDSLIDKDVEKKYYFCGAVSKKGNIEYFSISSPGAYWSYASIYFKKPEGTLMALAYATKTQSLEYFDPLPDYFRSNDKTIVFNAIDKIINRIMGYTRHDINTLYVNHDKRFSEEENKISMIMKVIQELSVKNVLKQIDAIVQKYSLTTKNTMIALSGGYALNCPTNTHIIERYKFKEQLCAPCVNDGGLAIGMGLYFFYKKCNQFSYRFKNAFCGYSDKLQLDDTLDKYQEYIESVECTLNYVAEDILKGPIIWIDGRSEVGPRALGHRSIIANPMNILHKDLLNKYKQREWWRPVAPIVLEDDLENWFIEPFKSPYMLNNFQVREEVASQIPAVLHLDGSARVQSVNYNDDPEMFTVISKFKALTGVPIICNTSLNDKGEPIINTIEQAFNFGLRKEINIIYAYGHRILLKNHNSYRNERYLARADAVFTKHLEDKNRILKAANPHNISNIDFLTYLYSPTLRQYDITKKDKADKLTKLLKKLRKFNINLRGLEATGADFLKYQGSCDNYEAE